MSGERQQTVNDNVLIHSAIGAGPLSVVRDSKQSMAISQSTQLLGLALCEW